MPTTLEELIALVLSLQSRVAQAEARAEAAEARAEVLAKRVAELEAENAELKARLGKNSSNSHRPPSSDSPYKARPPRKKGQKKPGGQPGHKGVTRAWVPADQVSERKVVRVERCACGAALDGQPATTGSWSRQVVEVPEIKPYITEYVFETVACPCCRQKCVPAVPPEAATATGPHLTALAATLVGEYRLSRDAAAALLSSVLGMPLCAATVQACCAAVSAAVAPATAAVDTALPASKAVHMDETSWKQAGKLHWLWIAVGDAVTSFAIHARRGAGQLATWFPNGFDGVVTCDRWRPYERFKKRQLCWSHLLRDVQAILDAKRAGAEPATRLLEGATAMFEHWHRFKAGAIDRVELQRLTQTYRPTFEAFCKLGARQKRDRRWRALGADLLRQWPAVFRFLDESGVEPTNNAAERGLRGGVLWRRICQGSRTDEGSHFVQRLMTVAANCKRQGRPVIRFLADALLAWRAGVSPPSLLPLAT